ncbi:unnamed protein product [Lactuca virosa]|uniref:Uncharacterized protein n=1 Tax=Lactuca virosa TaxID=75947 RepID=A0AAU9N4M8_9ASTR|nr:unnamed protein product [Lactuca virosa]
MRKTMSLKPSPLRCLSLFRYFKGRLRRHRSTPVCQQPSFYVFGDLCLRLYSSFVGVARTGVKHATNPYG